MDDVMVSPESFGPGVHRQSHQQVLGVCFYDTPRARNVTDGRARMADRAFEEDRTRLRAVGYRMLGSVSEADDAVQEAWLRLSRADTSSVENLTGWQRRVVDAFLAASGGGDFDALVALLHPDVVLRADPAAGPTPAPIVIRGARTVAKGALAAMERARFTQPALVNKAVGLAMAPRGRLFLVLGFTIAEGKITEIDVIADPDRLRHLDLAVLDG
jgi:hypothetical protein